MKGKRMSTNSCKICGKSNDIFTLEFEAQETDAGEKWQTHVCGLCWEIISAIAVRAVMGQLEVYAGAIKRKTVERKTE